MLIDEGNLQKILSFLAAKKIAFPPYFLYEHVGVRSYYRQTDEQNDYILEESSFILNNQKIALLPKTFQTDRRMDRRTDTWN